MQVEHALPRLLADVGDHPVAVQALLLRQPGDDLEDVGHHRAVVRRDLGHGADVGLGHHQEVGGRLGIDVVEGVADIVLVDLAAGDLPGNDLAEQTIGHFKTSFEMGSI